MLTSFSSFLSFFVPLYPAVLIGQIHLFGYNVFQRSQGGEGGGSPGQPKGRGQIMLNHLYLKTHCGQFSGIGGYLQVVGYRVHTVQDTGCILYRIQSAYCIGYRVHTVQDTGGILYRIQGVYCIGYRVHTVYDTGYRLN